MKPSSLLLVLLVVAGSIGPAAAVLGRSNAWLDPDSYTGVFESAATLAQYLAGFFDGDGGTRDGYVEFHQSSKAFLTFLVDHVIPDEYLVNDDGSQAWEINRRHDNNYHPGQFNGGSSLYTLTFKGDAAVALANFLLPHVILKKRQLRWLTNGRPGGPRAKPGYDSDGAIRRAFRRVTLAYIGGLFDAEGSSFFDHTGLPIAGGGRRWYSRMGLSIASSIPALLNLLLRHPLFGGWQLKPGFIKTARFRLVPLFMNQIILAGYCLRKGFKAWAMYSVWFWNDRHGYLESLSGYPEGYKPSNERGEQGRANLRPDALMSQFYMFYLWRGPVKSPPYGNYNYRTYLPQNITPRNVPRDRLVDPDINTWLLFYADRQVARWKPEWAQ